MKTQFLLSNKQIRNWDDFSLKMYPTVFLITDEVVLTLSYISSTYSVTLFPFLAKTNHMDLLFRFVNKAEGVFEIAIIKILGNIAKEEYQDFRKKYFAMNLFKIQNIYLTTAIYYNQNATKLFVQNGLHKFSNSKCNRQLNFYMYMYPFIFNQIYLYCSNCTENF